MPVVPFADSAATRSKVSASSTPMLPPTPPAEPFALMAAAQMHSEGRLIEPKGGEYIGELSKDDDLSYTHSVPIGRRKGEYIERFADPKELMKDQPAGTEGYTLPGNPYLWIRKKSEGIPMS